MRGSEDALPQRCDGLERRHGLAEIVERGAFVPVERQRVKPPIFEDTAASNYAALLKKLNRFEEAKVLLRKVLPVVRRNKGDSSMNTLKMRWNYADALSNDGATLDDLREAVTTLEETARIARRVLGGSHPITEGIEADLERSRAALRAASSRTRGAAIIYAAAALAVAAYLAT